MRVLCLTLLAAIVVATSASFPAAAAPSAPGQAVTLSASAEPSRLLPGATVTYTDALTSTGDVAGSGIGLTHALPAGFTYVARQLHEHRPSLWPRGRRAPRWTARPAPSSGSFRPRWIVRWQAPDS